MQRVAKNEYGFSLLELLTVLAIIGILAAMATLGMDFVRRERVMSASRMLLADLQRMRGQSLTSAPPAAMPTLRGFGVNFISSSSYSTFTFNDSFPPPGGNFIYDEAAEAINARTTAIPVSVQLTINGAAPDNRILIFDRFGTPRADTWEFGIMTIVLTDPRVATDARCIVVSETRIREGNFAGGTCYQQ
ncbi:MAG TPA: prepilin-type N-terminal cleavage/methylation domain-containing protein [Nitrospirota bacterium]|nr:prepilin-type N-terminal cleavage/methylation domain-containing protein [Nitrospirota bacterium]